VRITGDRRAHQRDGHHPRANHAVASDSFACSASSRARRRCFRL
jgi:hypothetical protein